MRIGSAFAGIGGFDLAFERAGASVAWQVEIDPACLRILERQWPGVKRHDDIRTAAEADLEPVDIITGGWPCQDLSVAGPRAGLSGSRSGLFFDLCRLIGQLRPTWLVLENVPGLLSSNRGRDMGIVLGTLEELGYSVAWRVLDAQYYGVPQRRRRVFFVGHLGDDWRPPAAVLFDAASCRWDLAPRREAGSTVATLLASGAGTSRPAGIASETDFLVPVCAHALTTRGGVRHDPTSETLPRLTVRRLTPWECERLQGFPDDWTAFDAQGRMLSDSVRYRMLGNAVAVPVVEWIARRLVHVDALLKGGEHGC